MTGSHPGVGWALNQYGHLFKKGGHPDRDEHTENVAGGQRSGRHIYNTLTGNARDCRSPRSWGAGWSARGASCKPVWASTLPSRETVNSVVFPTRGFVTADLGRSFRCEGRRASLRLSSLPPGGLGSVRTCAALGRSCLTIVSAEVTGHRASSVRHAPAL